MSEVVISDFGVQDISAVIRLARDYVARSAYKDIGMDENQVAVEIAKLPMLNKNIFRAFVAYIDDTLVGFLFVERQRPWFNHGKSLVIEQFYAVSPEAPADTSGKMLDVFEQWAFSDPSTVVAIWQSFLGTGREEAIKVFMERRGATATEQTWIFSRPKVA